VPIAAVDQALLGPVATLIAVTLAVLGVARADPKSPPWLRVAVRAVLLLLAADMQVAALILLLGPTPLQDGISSGDVRVRNVVGLGLGLAIWLAVLIRLRIRTGKI
jgi:hypothetical protein